MRKKIGKILVCIVSLAVVIGCGIFAYAAWKGYQEEKKTMAAGRNAEIVEAFHDQGGIYMSPSAPKKDEAVTIRLRGNRYNLTKAQIQVTTDRGTTWECYDMAYEKKDDTGYYDLWVGQIPAKEEPYFYRFAVGNDGTEATMYLGVEGLKSYQLDVEEMFYCMPGFDTPKWSQGALWYYIHTGQFYNGDTSNDIYREYLMKDNAYGDDTQSMSRGSGDLAGIIEKLDYIQDFGVTALALGPFFSTSEMFGFGTDNMEAVETAYGTEEQIQKLIREVHDRDMKITTDMVISYATNYSKYYNAYGFFPGEGAYQSKDSKYYPMFLFPQWPYDGVKIWNSMGLNIANEDAAKLIYKNADSMVLRYLNEPYGLDGYRFDAEESVGNLGYEYKPEKYFNGIREAIKGVSGEKLILAENCTGIANQYNELFDSSWQKNGYFAMKDWMNGKKTGTEMLKVLQDNLINTARPRALSSYNFLGQHDVVRLWDDTEEQKNDIAAVLLLQMTYMGSPVIYYGDETGLTNGYYHNQSASNFLWDESQWDYDILNLVKALGQARKEYSCLKDGVICHGEADDAQLFLAFGRFDENGAVITLCNKQGKLMEHEINVSRYNISDGDVLTDYLTGAAYTVKNGKITVNVIPGGTLLVTGKASQYRSHYTVSNIGKDLTVVQKDEKQFELTGKGVLSGKKDSIGFMEAKVFNNMALSAEITPEKKGKAALLFRKDQEADSAFYAAVVENGRLTVLARSEAGDSVATITEAEIPEGAAVQVARENGNHFVTYYRESEEGAWTLVDKSACVLAMPEEIYGGMTSLKGSSVFDKVTLEEKEQQICDSFDKETLGSMFTADEGTTLSDGHLTLRAGESTPIFAWANAHTSDFTFKTRVGGLKDSGNGTAAAGVMSMADKEDAVVLARAQIDGKKLLVFGKLLGGKLQVSGSMEDSDPDADVTLQLQRIGSMYTAVVSYDDTNWQKIGGSLYCNYTELHAGLWTWNATASFDYACFGNSITDGASVNTPITPGTIETDFSEHLHNIEDDKMTYLGNEDTWEDVGSGYAQRKAEGISLLYCRNKLFEDVKAEATITLTDGSGTAGILIGKQKNTRDTAACYQIALNGEKEVTILVDGKELAKGKVETKGDSVRLIVRRENGYLHVMAGENGTPLLSISEDTYGKGYVAYYTDSVAASFTNYDITALGNVWHCNSTMLGTGGVIELLENSALATLEGVGLTEGIITFQANISMPEGDKENKIGVLLGGSSYRLAGYGAVSVLYNAKTGVLEAMEGADSLGKVSLTEPGTSEGISLMVVFRNGVYDIYANQSAEPMLSVKASKPNGGGVSFYKNTGVGTVYNVKVLDITGTSDMEDLDIVKEWRSTEAKQKYTIAVAGTDGQAVKDDFSNEEGWNKNFYKIKTDWADWYVKDGILKADSIGKNWNIATIISGLYRDVDVKFKIRFTEYSSSSSVYLTVGKQRIYAGAGDSGLTFSINGSGLVSISDNAGKGRLNDWNTYISGLDEWFEIEVKAVNGHVTAYIDGTEVYSGQADSLSSGYVALQSDYVNLEVDDLSVTPLR